MELWIRSQNKEKLVKINDLNLYDRNLIKNDFVLNTEKDYSNIMIIANDNINLGTYKSKERALEVLDEIQDKIKTLLYLKPKSLLRLEDIEKTKKHLEELNDINFITTDNQFEIEAITTNIIVYQMPEK